MKNRILVISIIILAGLSAASEISVRSLLKGKDDFSDFEIAELPGIGLCISLEGDSLMYLDDPELPVLHLESKTDSREIIVCDTTVYVSIGEAVYADSNTEPVIILDNDRFRLYPAGEKAFYVCTSDSIWSNLILVDPISKAYSVVTEIDAPIRKVVSNDTHTFALLDNDIVALGAGNEIVPIFSGQNINDIALSPLGMFIATDDGLYSTSKQSELKYWSKRTYLRVWWIGGTLYLLDTDNNLFAVDGLKE